MSTATENAREIVHEWEKNSNDTVRVSLSEYQGHPLIELRVWYRDRATQEIKPSPKGFAFQRSQLPELEEAVRKLREAVGEAP